MPRPYLALRVYLDSVMSCVIVADSRVSFRVKEVDVSRLCGQWHYPSRDVERSYTVPLCTGSVVGVYLIISSLKKLRTANEV